MTVHQSHEGQAPLSVVLRALAAQTDGAITLGELIGHFGPRAFGAALFVLAIPNLLPLPPGGTTLLGLPLLLVAPQLALGVRRLRLPRPIARRTIDRGALSTVCLRAAAWLERIEGVTTHRLSFMAGALGEKAIGLVCTALAAVLILPIPLGNMLPAFAIAVLALGLAQRDGAIIILGHLLAAASAGVLFLGWRLAVAATDQLGAMTGLW